MPIQKELFSSASAEWETPDDVFKPLNEEFGFTLDPCCTRENHKCPKFYTKDEDGLKHSWGSEIVFVNPPYGHEIEKWIRKSFHESRRGALVVMLIPARTDTRWWHDYCMKGEVRFIKGRIHFINRTLPSYNGVHTKTSPAPFPSAIVVFRPPKLRMKNAGDYL